MREITRLIRMGPRTFPQQHLTLRRRDLSSDEFQMLCEAVAGDHHVLLNTEYGPWLFQVSASDVDTRPWFTLVSARPPGRP